MDRNRLDRLTEQQRACLRHVYLHLTSREIAMRMGIAPESVDRHIKAAMKTLGVGDRRTAARALAEYLAEPDIRPSIVPSPEIAVPPEADAPTETSEEVPRPPPPPIPPAGAEALVALFCNRDMREAVLGDLDEKFADLAERRGARVAKAWYWGQAGRSVLFFAVRWGRRLLELEAILKRIL